jgi:uncharacterized protein (TIGR02099 family)
MLNHLKKLTTFKNLMIYIVVHGVIIVAVLFSAVRFLIPYIKGSLPEIEQMASESFGLEIKVGTMETGWRGLEPVLRFEGVSMLNAHTHETIAYVHYFDVQLDLFASLRHWKFMPGRLTLDGIKLVVEQQPDGSFRFQNHALVSDRPWAESLGTILTQFKRLEVKRGDFEVKMKEGSPLYFHLNYMSFSPRRGNYRFETEIVGTQIPGELTVIADIRGKLEALENSTIDGYLHLVNVHYDERLFPPHFYSIKPQSGILNLDTWFEWREGHWQQLNGSLALSQVMLQNTQHHDLTMPMSVEANIAWQQLGGDFWRLSGDKIKLRLGSTGSPEASFMLEGGSFEPWNFRLSTIAVNDVLDALTLTDQLDLQTREAFRHLDMQGNLHEVQWIGMPGAEGFKDWHLGIQLNDLNWHPYQRIPGANHFSGELKFTPHHGQFVIDSKDVALILPYAFEGPLNFDAVRGTLAWTHDGVWTLQTQDLRMATADTALDTKFTLIAPNDLNDVTLDMIITSGGFDQQVAKKYLPTRILPPPVIEWINQSVERGRVNSMKTIVKGPLKLFPFKKGQGEFDLRFSLEDIDLHFHPAWPTAKHLTGELVIDGNGLQAFVDSGTLYDTVISNSTLSLPFDHGSDPLILHIAGVLKGSCKDAENFLRASPLWDKLGSLFDTVSLNGDLTLDLKTDIPLRAASDKFKLNGKASLAKGMVAIKPWKLALESVNGDLQFTQNSVQADNIQGKFLGKEALLSAKTAMKGNESEITWNLHTRFDKPFITQFSPSPYWNYLEGGSEVDASFKVYIPKRNDPFSLTLSSTLEGIALHLPSPMAKSAEVKMPSSITLTFLKPEMLQASFSYGTLAQGLFNLMKKKTGYSLIQGQFVAGSEKSPLALPHSGLMITGHAPAIAIQTWMDFLANHQKVYPSDSSDKLPEVVIKDFRVDDLQYKSWHLSHAKMSALRSQEHWQVVMNSDELEGAMRFPLRWGQSPMIFDLQRCTWPLGNDSSTPSMSTLTPKDVIPIDFKCADFTYKKSDLGRVHLGVTPHHENLTVIFNPIFLESKNDHLSATGSWGPKNGVMISAFKGEATSQNAGKSLRAWGLPTDVQDAKGEGQFDLSWPGSPTEISMQGLAGELDVRMENGRFVGVNPGFGRMLGLLSFQGLQRRLRLDFSDVFKQGFGFDTFKSNITIKDGTAMTKNAAIKAPAADLTFSGTTNLVAKTLDIDMYVQAHIDSTVPAAAVALANPAAGAAVWVVDKIFNPLGNVSRYRYRVTGTWEKPVFTDLTKEYRKELEGPAKVKEAQ